MKVLAQLQLAGLARSCWTHPIPGPAAQPCWVIASPQVGKGLCSPVCHCSCAAPSRATTDGATGQLLGIPLQWSLVPAEMDIQ